MVVGLKIRFYRFTLFLLYNNARLKESMKTQLNKNTRNEKSLKKSL